MNHHQIILALQLLAEERVGTGLRAAARREDAQLAKSHEVNRGRTRR